MYVVSAAFSLVTRLLDFLQQMFSLPLFASYPHSVYTILVCVRELYLHIQCNTRCWCSALPDNQGTIMLITWNAKIFWFNLVDSNRKCARRQGFINNWFSLPISRLKPLFLTSEICRFLSAGEVVNPPTHVCSDCPGTVLTDSAELKELLKVAVEKFNLETDDDFYYQVSEIESATVEVKSYFNF